MRSAAIFCALCTLFISPAAASAGGVLVLGSDGVRHRSDPGVAATGERVPRARTRPARGVRATTSASRRTVIRELKRLRNAGAIHPDEYAERRRRYEDAKALVKRLSGRRRVEVAGTVAMLDRFAARGALSASRLPALWLTLERNRRWWTTGPLLTSGRRVSFRGSELVWQYVPGQGLQIHPLANFGKLNALWRQKTQDARLELLLDELLELPARRGNSGIAWEYHFEYGGGRAPWVSGLAQGTGLQAIARAAIRLGRKEEIWPIAREGLGIFDAAPPVGVRVPSANGGVHYLLYSFNSDLRVLNGFVQALVGLFDFGKYVNDDRARALFAAGELAARTEVPRYDTGAWSRYSQYRESDLGYHRLVTDFLDSLCDRTSTEPYCSTRDNFRRYLTEPPAVETVTRRLRGGRRGLVRLRLSKLSTVVMRISRGGRPVFHSTLTMGGGARALAWPVPRRPGDYDVRLTATDMAGNVGSTTDVVEVLRPRRKARRG